MDIIDLMPWIFAILFIGLIVEIAIITPSEFKDCEKTCQDFNYSYVQYNSGSFSESSCWCKTQNNTPVRVS